MLASGHHVLHGHLRNRHICCQIAKSDHIRRHRQPDVEQPESQPLVNNRDQCRHHNLLHADNTLDDAPSLPTAVVDIPEHRGLLRKERAEPAVEGQAQPEQDERVQQPGNARKQRAATERRRNRVLPGIHRAIPRCRSVKPSPVKRLGLQRVCGQN